MEYDAIDRIGIIIYIIIFSAVEWFWVKKLEKSGIMLRNRIGLIYLAVTLIMTVVPIVINILFGNEIDILLFADCVTVGCGCAPGVVFGILSYYETSMGRRNTDGQNSCSDKL